MSRNDLAQGKLRSCGGGPASTAALLGGGGSLRAAFARSWPEKNNDAVTCARVVIRKMARLAIDWLRTLVPCPSLQRPQAVMVATSKTRLPKETCSTGTLPRSAHARGAGVGVVGVMTGVRVQGAVAVVGQCPIARAGCGVGWHGRSAHAHTCQHCRHAHTWRATVEWSAAVAVAGGVMCAVQCLAVASEPRRHDRGVQRCGACGWAGVAPRAVQWLRRPLHDHRARRSVCPQGTV